MRLHFGGKFTTESDFKSQREPVEGAIAFREMNQAAFAIVANIGCVVTLVLLCLSIYGEADADLQTFLFRLFPASILSVVILIPHEILHAVCFQEDVYLYFDPARFLVFVHGTESMSKLRFIFMSMLPNIVFGIIPLVMFLIHRDWLLIGITGAFCFSMGFGDYINVFHALTQMPRGAKTYLSGFHSYWYR